MLDIRFVRDNPEEVKRGLQRKGVDFDVDAFLKLDERRRKKIQEVDDMRSIQNTAAGDIAKIKEKENRDKKISESKELKERLIRSEEELKVLDAEFAGLIVGIPNLPLKNVPDGLGEKGNIVLREVDENGTAYPRGESPKPKFSFTPRDYMDIAKKLDIIDTERASRVSGSRFGYLKREAALLEFALVRYAFDLVCDEKNIESVAKELDLSLKPIPFIPIIPPALVKPESMRAMGYVERGGDEIYHIEKDDMYVVGTSEQSVGPMHIHETFEEKDLPMRYISFSTCFRREAGSYGKDTKGILRVHQFDKAEMVIFATPETSEEEHLLLRGIEERLMKTLKIPYHVLNCCAGDLGDPAAAKYDIEAWLPGQNGGKGEYRETHSTSNTTDFQARRLNIKMRKKDGTTQFVHMLNGTAFAVGRMIIAIIENYQQEDGSVRIPDVLQKYIGGMKEIRR
ncbi:MAG: serine--tRNA ligase [Candidatus Sungbacteria bacterium RIFCSPLOWO2_01_FULL_47_10]|uniref:Serine--tRNA ligase n=1 Tax=Candidatus Sungbacteria bacterium RIFCSPLOWO2_01_FULL_47_10 TaxID=1802276 RepID=A0A1G2KYJ9_9BACT|nr:MAG: serine--tRNA ligase [Candidatus Sungbacteria bacterium RIFCSPLOWO2_01_FULL_47_10]